jgi:imidazolonepropionase-like amidohydrolase
MVRRLGVFIVAFSCILAFSAPLEASEGPAEWCVVKNGKVFTSAGAQPETLQILIRDGRIVAVATQVEAPPDAEVIDADGLIVYPGFIDACIYSGITQAEPTDAERRRLEDESPDVVQGPQSKTVEAYRRLIHPHWRAEESFDAKAAKLDEIRSKGFTAALVSFKPAIFSGASAVIELGDLPLRKSVLRSGVAQHAAFVTGEEPRFDRRRRGGDDGARPDYPVTTMGAMAAFRQVMHDSTWHQALSAWSLRHPGEDRCPIDRDLETLAKLPKSGMPVAFLANKEDEIYRALNMADEFELSPVIVGGREAWKAAARLKTQRVPVIVSLRWSEEPKWPKAPKEDAPSGTSQTSKPSRGKEGWEDVRPLFDERWESQMFESQRLFEERRRLWGEEVDNAKRLAEAGLQVAFASYEMKTLKEFFENLRSCMERGLPPQAALAGLTSNAATILGVADQVGTIQPGRLANLTIMTGPLEEKKSKVQWVLIEGKRYDAEQPSRDRKRGRDRDKDSEDRSKDDELESPTAASAPANQPTSQPAPEFACEIEADRRPGLVTGGQLLIRNASVLTITGGDLAQTDLLIKDGVIASIGKNLAAPSGVKVIDLSGYYVMPGIVDPHSHICTTGGLNEYSLSVSCEVRVPDVIDPTQVSAYRALAGGVTTIHTMHGSANTIGGQNAVLRLKYGKPATDWLFREAPRTVKFALGENVKQSNFGAKGTRFPNTRMGVEAVFNRSFDAARCYQEQLDEFAAKRGETSGDPKPVRRDLRLEALLSILKGEIWVHCHCYRADEILRLLHVAETFGFRIGVLQHVLEGYRIIPEIARHGCGASTFSDWWAYKLEAFDAIPHNAARMMQGGVNATINSDSAEMMRHLHQEAAKSVHFGGLAPNDALRLITINGAMQLGIQDHVGSIEIGKKADLAVFNAHPLDTLSRCVLTLIDGEAYFQDRAFDAAAPAPAGVSPVIQPPSSTLNIPPSPNGEYLIVGATVHPISGPAVHKAAVRISGGKIQSVSADSGSSAPSAVRIEATNLHVYPGLIDAGSVLGLTEINSVAGGEDRADIGDFQPDLMTVSAYNPFATAIEVARCEGITTTMLVPPGGPVAGRAGVVRLAGWSMPEALVSQAGGLVVSLPSLPIKWPDLMPDEKREEQVKEHRKKLAAIEAFFRDAAHYARRRTTQAGATSKAIEINRQFEAMIPFVSGNLPVIFRADSYKQIREALRFAECYQLRAVIYGGAEAWKLAEELARRKIDVIVVRATSYPAGEFEPYDSVYSNAAALHRAGVRFCFATGESSLSKLLRVEAGTAASYGLDPDAAIRAITLDAAEVIGAGDRIGSIEAGKDADLIITTGSPLQASAAVVGEFISGKPVKLESKHSRMDDLFRSRPQPSLGPATQLRGPKPLRPTADVGK